MSWKSREELDKEYLKRIREVEKKIAPLKKDSNEQKVSVHVVSNVEAKDSLVKDKDKDKDSFIFTENALELEEDVQQKENGEITAIEVEKKTGKEVYDDFTLSSIIESAREGKKNERLSSIDTLSHYLDHDEVIYILIEIARKDPYHICRAKAVSILAEKIENSFVKELILEKITDSSKEVRKWVIWALKGNIQDKTIQDALTRHLIYTESSKEVKMWIINALSSCIDNEDVEYTFLRLLKSNLSYEMRSLVVDTLLSKIYDAEVLYGLSKHLFKEPNKTIRKKIVLALKKVNNMDSRFTLERLSKVEKDEELKNLLSSTVN